jgi:predicted RNase H-like HicB family nuclease
MRSILAARVRPFCPYPEPLGVTASALYLAIAPHMGNFVRYRIALRQSDEGFSVSVRGLPGCWSQGAAEAEALENIKDANREYLAVIDEQLRGARVREI